MRFFLSHSLSFSRSASLLTLPSPFSLSLSIVLFATAEPYSKMQFLVWIFHFRSLGERQKKKIGLEQWDRENARDEDSNRLLKFAYVFLFCTMRFFEYDDIVFFFFLLLRSALLSFSRFTLYCVCGVRVIVFLKLVHIWTESGDRERERMSVMMSERKKFEYMYIAQCKWKARIN